MKELLKGADLPWRRAMRRIYFSVVFVAILACSLASMIAIQRVVSNIAKPDVLPEGVETRNAQRQ
jgi:hypothetical protein